MKNKFRTKVFRGILFALCIFAFTMNLLACGSKNAETTVAASETNVTAESTGPVIPDDAVEYMGKYYIPKEGLQTVLFMGLDKNEDACAESSIAYTNSMQSDFMMLFILDEAAGVCDVLHLNRDTMTEIYGMRIGATVAETFVGRLALAHTYGSGGSDSCLNAVKAVSNLLGGVSVDHYITLTMDAVAKMNDLVGGVTVTLLEDFTQYDPQMRKGAEFTLKGEQALTYVRFRLAADDGLNASRMARQEQYLSAFYAKLMEKNREDEAFLNKALQDVNASFTSDLTVTQLDKLSESMTVCTCNPFRSLKGQTVKGEEYDEYHLDEAARQKTILDLFYVEAHIE